MFSSYRTTLTGVATILGGIVGIVMAIAQEDGPNGEGLAAGVTAIIAGIGFFFARDNKVSSEEAEAGKFDPNKKPMGMMIVFALASAVAVSGCAGLGAGAANDPMKYKLQFGDRIGGGNADPASTSDDSQITDFNVEIEAPAGTKLEDLVSMVYDVEADGSSHIAISKSASSDQTGQMELLKFMYEMNAQSQQQFIEQWNVVRLAEGLAPIAAPLIGANMTNKANQAQIDASNKMQWRSMVLDALTDPEVIKAWAPLLRNELGVKVPKPKPVVEPTPEPTPEPPAVVALPEE